MGVEHTRGKSSQSAEDARVSRGGKEDRAVAGQHYSRSSLPSCSRCSVDYVLVAACTAQRQERSVLSLTLASVDLLSCRVLPHTLAETGRHVRHTGYQP